ncbi:MAG: hypothetical protein FJW19_04795 [Actinobacteria bacterium]|nr:hypothetical protein [Actinomycetota bacterium]
MAVAAILTILALPLLMINRGSDNADDATDAAGATTTTQASSSTGMTEDEVPEPIILGGPSPIVQDGSAQIAYPSSALTGVQATATFSNFDGAPEIVCYMPQAPLGLKVTVQNLNNGRITSCTNVFRATMPSGATMILHTKVFESLANLVDAPIPVTVSW